MKKWLKDKCYGFLDNGNGPDIMVRQADLIKCQYLKVGATVEFECYSDKKGLIAKKVKLLAHNNKKNMRNSTHHQSAKHNGKHHNGNHHNGNHHNGNHHNGNHNNGNNNGQNYREHRIGVMT